MKRVVSNASPLIILAKVGQFERLRDLFGRIEISPQVREEVVDRGKGRAGAQEVSSAGYVVTTPVKSAGRIAEIREGYQIAAGEASTITLAEEMGADLVLMDDRQARAAARSIGLKVVGTLRVLEMAYEGGHLSDLRSTYKTLKASTSRIRPSLIDASLRRLGLST